MANQNIVTGLQPVGTPLRVNRYVAGGVVYPGDAVKPDNTGRVVAASASNALMGVAISYASAAGQDVWVADHPDQQFVAVADDGTVSAQSALMLNYNIVAGTADTTYLTSKHQLDASSGATDSILPLRALRIQPAAGETGFGTGARVVVQINNHSLKGGTGTEGI